MKKKKIFYQITLGLIYLLLIVWFSYESLKNGPESSSTSNSVGTIISEVVSTVTNKEFIVTDEIRSFIRKFIGHFSYFFILGIVSTLFYFSFDNKKNYIILFSINYISGFTFAFVTEFVFQKNSMGRTPSLQDVFIDVLGFIFLSGFICQWYFFKNQSIYKNLR